MPHPLDMKKTPINNVLIKKDNNIGLFKGIRDSSTIILVIIF